jgi:hypothetical protein
MVTIFNNISYTIFKDAATNAEVYYHINPKGDGYTLGTGNSDIIYGTRIKDPADIADFAATLESSAILVNKEEDVLASPSLAQTGTLQVQYDLSDDNFIYIGKARPGIATNAIGWTIERYTKVSGVATDKKTTVQNDAVWVDRSVENYN